MKPILMIIGILLLLSACSGPAVSAPQPVSPVNVTPYATVTLSLPPTPTPGATEIPIPTPTPFPYAIARGDTLSTIAQRFNIQLDELLVANPGIVPQSLSVGQTISIPSVSSKTESNPTEVPASLVIGPVSCYPSGGGTWCLALVFNPNPVPVENILLQISLLDASGAVRDTRQAYPLLNIIQPGASIPLGAFFQQNIPGIGGIASLQSAIQLSLDDPRYLNVSASNIQTHIQWDGRSAVVSGELLLAGSRPASQIWVLAVALDKTGQPVGLRRWEWAGSLAAGQSLPFNLDVFSLGPEISQISVTVESRP